ncbi:DoxX family protein [Allopusillimonas ginsengisoli]|uniref:DoxX family protein n=1 Tax=Allopusillimonas ginsengisoli TaxID=453575 RepID=UPI0010C21520|nr:DoxX family protein [Allopusillimonas ginsengisoli]
MSSNTLEDLGKLVLRLTVGILLLFHGIAKMRYGISGIESMVVARGLPAFFSWAVYIGEVVAPLMLIFGLYTRVAGLIVAINLLFAIALVHTGHLSQFSNTGGWRLELQGLYLFGGLAIAMLGAGRYAIGNRWN